MVSSHARHAVVGVENTPSTKRHQQWYLFVFGVCQLVWRGNKHENTPITGGFRGLPISLVDMFWQPSKAMALR